MRLKAEAIFDFGTDGEQSQNKIVREYRDEYKTISGILDRSTTKILDHGPSRSRPALQGDDAREAEKPVFTSENLFRAILVMQREGMDYRASIGADRREPDIAELSVDLLKKPTIDFTLLNKAFCVHYSPETWEMINDVNSPSVLCRKATLIYDRSCSHGHDGHRMQHSLADRLEPALGYVSRDRPRNLKRGREIDPSELSVAISREED